VKQKDCPTEFIVFVLSRLKFPKTFLTLQVPPLHTAAAGVPTRPPAHPLPLPLDRPPLSRSVSQSKKIAKVEKKLRWVFLHMHLCCRLPNAIKNLAETLLKTAALFF
jgi:hypothetical protein